MRFIERTSWQAGRALLGALLVLGAFAACSSDETPDLPVVEDFPPRASGPDAELPEAATVHVTGYSAMDLIERSDSAMKDVPAVSVEIETFYGAQSQDTRTLTLLPLQYSTDPRLVSGDPSVMRRILDRTAGGFQRSGELMASALAVTPARDARILGTGTVDGRDAWVVWHRYTAPSVESPFEVWRIEWIAQDDFTLLRQISDTFDPWGPAEQREVLTVTPVDAS